MPDQATASLEAIDWSLYDFADLGCSKGGSLEFCRRRFGAGRGVGIDLDAAKVARSREQGLDAVQADAAALEATDAVRFVSMMDFLEHLPNLDTVERVIASSARLASDFIFIRHPSFEGEGTIEHLGLRQYWWDWTGHKAHVTVADYCEILDRLGLRQYCIRHRERVVDSSHPSLIPTALPPDQGPFDPQAHPVKPEVALPTALWRAQDILVALRSFDPSEWSAIVDSVDGGRRSGG